MNKTLTEVLGQVLFALTERQKGNIIRSEDQYIDEARTLLAAQQPEPRDAIARSKRILGLVDSYHENPTQHTRTALRVALMDEFQPEPRDEVTDGQIAAMFERVTGYSLKNGIAALNDADILGFARELLDAARAGEGQ
ncbi:hypothetical protein [Burkholderia ambifaria]|jgi:hypothetical protein|uniref:hypothetical protein n=1 Tax=Burkholderia ambifaria TaxID=152480 RepID=UPI00158957E5|nr:hypothetical protein [Burkholderia ambifaria]